MSDSSSPTGVAWFKQAKKDLRKLTKRDAVRVQQAVRHFADGASGDYRRLRGYHPLYWLRVRNWRVMIGHGNGVFKILRVFHGREAYRMSAWIRQAAPRAEDGAPSETSQDSPSPSAQERIDIQDANPRFPSD